MQSLDDIYIDNNQDQSKEYDEVNKIEKSELKNNCNSIILYFSNIII